MKTIVMYFIIIQAYPKDSLDNSYRYDCISNLDRRYTVFTDRYKQVGDTLFLRKDRH